jgi:hypothetical protein
MLPAPVKSRLRFTDTTPRSLHKLHKMNACLEDPSISIVFLRRYLTAFDDGSAIKAARQI